MGGLRMRIWCRNQPLVYLTFLFCHPAKFSHCGPGKWILIQLWVVTLRNKTVDLWKFKHLLICMVRYSLFLNFGLLTWARPWNLFPDSRGLSRCGKEQFHYVVLNVIQQDMITSQHTNVNVSRPTPHPFRISTASVKQVSMAKLNLKKQMNKRH